MPSLKKDLFGFFSHWVVGFIQIVAGFLGMFAVMALWANFQSPEEWAEMSGLGKAIISLIVLAPLTLAFAGLRRIRPSHDREGS